MRRKVYALGFLAAVAGFLIASASPALADEGIATWYGPGFHGNVMANGQIYDMNDPTTTAANIFPFGTWVKVTNLANGKTVVVQVRDRGGFKHALDLSHAAFALLDDPKKMVIRIRYEVVPGPESEGKERASDPPSSATPVAPKPTPVPTKPQPTPQPQAKPAAPSAVQDQYAVVPGDTLSGIARRFGVGTQFLVNLNALPNADSIIIGQVIKLREDDPDRITPPRAADSSGSRGATGASGQRSHVVQAGETLSNIAERFDIAVERIVAINNIADPNLVRVGDELSLSATSNKPGGGPAGNASPTVHVVQSGDTLGEIALQYGLPEEVLAKLNQLDSADRIIIGQELRLAADGEHSNAASPPGTKEYAVQVGDTLFGIALERGITVAALVALNDLENQDLLQPGQLLRLP